MHFFVLLIFSFAIFGCRHVDQDTNLSTNGIEDKDNKYSNTLMFRLSFGSSAVVKGHCSATKISPTQILTAAHCVDSKSGIAASHVLVLSNAIASFVSKINFNGEELNPGPSHDIFYGLIRRIEIHPDYISEASQSTHPQHYIFTDIAVVTFANPLPANVPITELDSSASVSDDMVVVGYGSGGLSDYQLKRFSVLTKENKRRLQSPSTLTIDVLKSADSVTSGDSGGPLLDAKSLKQIGISQSRTIVRDDSGEISKVLQNNFVPVAKAFAPHLYDWVTRAIKVGATEEPCKLSIALPNARLQKYIHDTALFAYQSCPSIVTNFSPDYNVVAMTPHTETLAVGSNITLTSDQHCPTGSSGSQLSFPPVANQFYIPILTAERNARYVNIFAIASDPKQCK